MTSSEALATPEPQSGQWLAVHRRGQSTALGQERACRTPAALFPDAHILIVTRSIEYLLASLYSQYVRTGGTLIWYDWADSYASGAQAGSELWNYDRLIGTYRELLAPGRVIVMPYELLRDDPQAFLDHLQGRLGPGPRPFPLEHVNTGLSPVELACYPAMAREMQNMRLPDRVAVRVERLCMRGTSTGRWQGAVRVLQRLRPRPLDSARELPDELTAASGSSSECLRAEDLYQPYLTEYFAGGCPGR